MTTTIIAPAPTQRGQNLPIPVEWVAWEIVHRLSGRLRIRIPRLGWDQEYGQRLERSLLKTTAIRESRVSFPACCVVVSYCPETCSEEVIEDYLEAAIQGASREEKPEPILVEAYWEASWPTVSLSILAMAVAIAAPPLQLPFWIVGGTILAAAVPLWQRVDQAINQQGEVTVDCLDALWLSAQLIQGNSLAGALALNLGAVGEGIRQQKLQQLEQELYVLFEQEDEAIHWLSDRKRFAPIPAADKQRWLHSVEATELLQKIKPIAQGAIWPTVLLSATLGISTGDLGRASAVLPLDLGVSLRGVTPLAVVSALTAAARQGVYIRNGRVLEKLAYIDTLVFALTDKDLGLFNPIANWKAHNLELYLMISEGEENWPAWAANLGIVSKQVKFTADGDEINSLIEQLQKEGRRVALICESSSYFDRTNPAEVLISLARGQFASQADVILHSHNLQSLAYTLAIARHTLFTAYESLAIAILPNLLAVAVGAVWGLNPVAAVLINGVSAILAELNSLSPLGHLTNY